MADPTEASAVRPSSIWLRVAVVAAFGLAMAAPPVAWWFVAPAQTRAADRTPWPEVAEHSIADGAWNRAVEGHLRTNDRIAYYWRGLYNEARIAIGAFEAEFIHVGPGGWTADGWTFVRTTLEPDLDADDPRRRRRLRNWREIAARCRRLGVQVLVAPVPDKVTLYPEHAFEDATLPPGKDRVYPALMAELEAAGFEVLDLRVPLRALRDQVGPEHAIFYKRDIHWRPEAAVSAAHAILDELRALGWRPDAGPRREYVVSGPADALMMPGTIGALPLLTEAEFNQPAASPFVRVMQETKQTYELAERLGDGEWRVLPEELPDAVVALVGTSFSMPLRRALPLYLEREVDSRGAIPAGGPFLGLRKTLDAIERGDLRARIIVWEFLERMFVAQCLAPWDR